MQTRMEAPKKFEDVLRRSPEPLRGEVPTPVAENPLRILFVTSAHNSLSQRCYIAVTEMGHDVTVQHLRRYVGASPRAAFGPQQAQSPASTLPARRVPAVNMQGDRIQWPTSVE